jgi:hypothetical protein
MPDLWGDIEQGASKANQAVRGFVRNPAWGKYASTGSKPPTRAAWVGRQKRRRKS